MRTVEIYYIVRTKNPDEANHRNFYLAFKTDVSNFSHTAFIHNTKHSCQVLLSVLFFLLRLTTTTGTVIAAAITIAPHTQQITA